MDFSASCFILFKLRTAPTQPPQPQWPLWCATLFSLFFLLCSVRCDSFFSKQTGLKHGNAQSTLAGNESAKLMVDRFLASDYCRQHLPSYPLKIDGMTEELVCDEDFFLHFCHWMHTEARHGTGGSKEYSFGTICEYNRKVLTYFEDKIKGDYKKRRMAPPEATHQFFAVLSVDDVPHCRNWLKKAESLLLRQMVQEDVQAGGSGMLIETSDPLFLDQLEAIAEQYARCGTQTALLRVCTLLSAYAAGGRTNEALVQTWPNLSYNQAHGVITQSFFQSKQGQVKPVVWLPSNGKPRVDILYALGCLASTDYFNIPPTASGRQIESEAVKSNGYLFPTVALLSDSRCNALVAASMYVSNVILALNCVRKNAFVSVEICNFH